MTIVEYLTNKRAFAVEQLERVNYLGAHNIPLDSALNGYYQGLRDMCTEMLARIRDGMYDGLGGNPEDLPEEIFAPV